MKRNIFKITMIFLSVFSLFLFGCGDDHNYSGDYISNITFSDAQEDGVITLDMYRVVCPSGDDEPFSDVFANITVTVSATSPGLTLNGYTVEYIPESSVDRTNTIVIPPTLNNLEDMGTETVYMPADGAVTFSLTCFSVDQKEAYRDLMTGAAYFDLIISRYTIRYVLHCTDDDGENKTIVAQKTVYFGPYDNC